MKAFYSLLFLICVVINIQAQDDNSIQELLSRSETSIYKLQKEMIAGHIEKKSQELTTAINFQALAVQSFKSNDLKLAVCYSLKSREISNIIFDQMKLTGRDYYMLNAAETKLKKDHNCISDADVYRLLTPFKDIDDSILYDPQKLQANFKISIN